MKISFFSSNNEVLTEIGHRIKAQRIAMNMTQEEIAEKTTENIRAEKCATEASCLQLNRY